MIRDAFNNPRGIAIDTIGDLLIEHSELFETFAPIIENLVQDESRIVHFALCKCIAACYKYDFSFATKMYDILLKEDPHVLYANTSFWIMSRDLHVLEAHYYPQLKAVCNSQNPQLILHVTQQICIAAILTSSKQILTFLYTYPWSEEAMDKICLEATRAYGVDRYHSTCQAIIEHFLSINAGCLKSINRLFRGHMLVFGRDENFIKSILHKRNSFDTVEAFIEFIKTKDIDISEFAEIISLAVDSIDEGANIWQKSRLEDGLVHTVIKLIDTCKYDNESTEDCLGILDKIYRKRILSNIAVLPVLDGSNR